MALCVRIIIKDYRMTERQDKTQGLTVVGSAAGVGFTHIKAGPNRLRKAI